MERSKEGIEADANLAAAKIKTSALANADQKAAAANVLVNFIPVAGGAVGAIIGEWSSSIRMAKICDVLACLNDAIANHGVDPNKHLTKDQIVEVVAEGIQTALTASDQEKIALLKRGLCYAFTSKEAFEDKQLYLTILRGLTSHEINLLGKIYRGSDPFRVELNKAEAGTASGVLVIVPPGRWINEGEQPSDGGQTLLQYLAGGDRVKEGWIKTAATMLDSKNLTTAAVHLSESYKIKFRWEASNYGPAHSPILSPYAPLISFAAVKETPLESSKTAYGVKFLAAFQ